MSSTRQMPCRNQIPLPQQAFHLFSIKKKKKKIAFRKNEGIIFHKAASGPWRPGICPLNPCCSEWLGCSRTGCEHLMNAAPGPQALLLSDPHLLTASSPSKWSADLSWKAHSPPFSSESSLHCSDDSLKRCLVTSHGSKRDSVFMTVGVDWIPPGDPSLSLGSP